MNCTAPAMLVPHSIYLHIPFCPVKCSYCAFNTYVGLDQLIPEYVAALTHEINLCGQASPSGLQSHTLYFGGGTPSMLAAEQVTDIIRACRSVLHLSDDAEITLEVEPNTVTLPKLMGYRRAGVNRISLGVQSSHDADLQLFRRGHTFNEARYTFDMLRVAGFENISVDLIYGAPGQTLTTWQKTLRSVVTWGPEHLSLYSLIVEPKTELTYQIEQGYLPAPNDDLAADMYDAARDILANSGYWHYELSTWAQSSRFEALHNHQYWGVQPYFGLGAGAHGATHNQRYWNVKPIRAYISRVYAAKPLVFGLSAAVEGCEQRGQRAAMAETMMLGLRRIHQGVRYDEFTARYGLDLRDIYYKELDELQHLKLVQLDNDVVKLGQDAYLIADAIARYFV